MCLNVGVMARAVAIPIPTEDLEGLKSEEKFANISDGSGLVADGKEGDRSGGSDGEEDKMVVERNGEFLLVSKNELEAEMALPLESSAEPNLQAASHSTVEDVTQNQQPVNKQNGGREEDGKLSPSPAVPCSTACTTKEEPTCASTDTVVDYGSSLSHHSLDGSCNGRHVRGGAKSTPPPQSFTRPTTSHAKNRLSSAPSSRSHSAPWLTAGPQAVKGGILFEDDDEGRRRRLNDDAFRSWLARKNRERIQRQKEKDASSQDVSEEERRERNAKAFQSWLSSKQRQVQAEVRLRPVSALPQSQSVSRTRGRESPEAAYEGWMRRKQAELQSRKKLDLERRKDQEELANSNDPQAGEKAFQL